MMIDREHREEIANQLYNLLAEVNDPEGIKALLDDMCTYQEVEKMSQRLYAAKLLINGATYNQVIEQTDISSATLSRVSRCVQYGKGYTSYIKKEEK